ncbi:MAG: VWA domain-containing protein [Candidatus Hydrogenedentota bacterium]|nr:MAG: VWA domain-containing protein [Candidatus Hydrogenedentota bacterium]
MPDLSNRNRLGGAQSDPPHANPVFSSNRSKLGPKPNSFPSRSVLEGGKKFRSPFAIIFCLTLLFPSFGSPLSAAETTPVGPYFLVSDSSSIESFPLERTEVRVEIAGVIAHVTVRQDYRNRGTEPIEAVYVFPASTRASVTGMVMKIGNRTIRAEVRRRKTARLLYETAKEQGRRTALLEQHRSNVFSTNVGNIMPGDHVSVELQYDKIVPLVRKEYTFVFPTVVGPRYVSAEEHSSATPSAFTSNPTLKNSSDSRLPQFLFHLTLSSPIPITKLVSPTHEIETLYPEPTTCEVTLKPKNGYPADRDFILKYSLRGKEPQAGLLLLPPDVQTEIDTTTDTSGYFLLLLEPPQRIETKTLPPRELLFILDVSGSMHGFPLEISKAVVRNLLLRLKPTDSFNILLFAGSSSTLADSPIPATPENLRRALALVENQTGGGGTELLSALEYAFALPRHSGLSRTILLLTDGYVNVEDKAFRLVRENLDRSNFFAFGVGSAVNRALIEGLSRAGGGKPFVVTHPRFAARAVADFVDLVSHPVATDLSLTVDGAGLSAFSPRRIPDLFQGRPIEVFGKWNGSLAGALHLRGRIGSRLFEKTFPIAEGKRSRKHRALRTLWARSRIAELEDEYALNSDQTTLERIADLGIRYSLLTRATSFVAIDEIAVNSGGRRKVVRQPLPLPSGVSTLAVGLDAEGLAGIVTTGSESFPPSTVFLSILFPFLFITLALFYCGRSPVGKGKPTGGGRFPNAP